MELSRKRKRNGASFFDDGPLVKWLRQRPLTPLTSVRIRYGSPALNCPEGTNPRLAARLLSQGGQFLASNLQTLRWFEGWGETKERKEVLDK